MAKTCIFCGGGGPFAKEHLLPEWTARLMRVKKVRVTPTATGTTRRAIKPWTSAGSFGTKVGSVCKGTCNNGWMSDLETLTKPILSKMILPTSRISMDVDEQLVIACWLWKLAILHEYFSDEVYFTSEERSCLMTDGAPPEFGVLMWIAGFKPGLHANIKGGVARFSAPDGRSVPGYMMSMTLKGFAAQLVCVRQMPDTGMSLSSRYTFEGGESAVWPEGNGPIEWPPEGGMLDERLFDRWHTRFNQEGVLT